ncbi:MAG: hypothetical protein ACPGYX_01235 [Oceanobacter sp.]
MKASVKLLSAAVILAGMATQTQAISLGEFDGTQVSVGGYIKATGAFNKPDADATDPTGVDLDNSFMGDARESRLNVAASSEVDGHKIKGFIEGDFWGGYYASSAYSWRLRHAYLQVDNFKVGQTWGGQFFSAALFDGEMLTMWGRSLGTLAGNGGTVRPVGLHYASKGLRVSLQDPINDDASIPDTIVSYTFGSKKGPALNLAAYARDVANGEENDMGTGFSLGAKLPVGSGEFKATAYTGTGLAVYSGVGVGGAYNPATVAAFDAENGELVSQVGYSVAYKHQISPKLRATLRRGAIMVDDEAESGVVIHSFNMVYNYLPKVELGFEARKQSLGTHNTPSTSNFPNVRPKGQQLEVMAKYKF